MTLSEDNPVRAIDVFVDELDLAGLGFGGVEPEATGRPAYHPATLLKIYVYGYLNRVHRAGTWERECQRNIELVWLTWLYFRRRHAEILAAGPRSIGSRNSGVWPRLSRASNPSGASLMIFRSGAAEQVTT